MADKINTTPDEMRQLVEYDAQSGILIWKSRPASYFRSERSAKIWNARYPGTPALNCPDRYGYAHGQLAGKRMYAHRVIWAIHHGEWPKLIDHIDGNLRNNRIENLRNVSQTTNMRNACLPSNNKSGAIGVRLMPDGRFKVQASAIFTDYDEAVAASRAARIAMGFHPNHGRRESTRQALHHALPAKSTGSDPVIDTLDARLN